MDAQQLFKAGKLSEAIPALNALLRDKPSDVRSRTFLFELLCFAGEYERAEKQLIILQEETSKDSMLGALLYRAALAAERTRQEMFARLAGAPVLVIGTHFAGATAGHVVRDGDGYRLVA